MTPKISKGLVYIPSDSWIHKLSGLTKFLTLILWITLCLGTFDYRLLFTALVLALFSILTSKIPLKKYLGLLYVMLVFVAINSFFIYLFSPQQGTIYYGTKTVVIGSGSYALTIETLEYLIVVSLKYFTLFPVALLFIFTTHPSEFASSLAKLHLPSHICYAVALTLRYIPEVTDNFTHILHGQTSRGVQLGKEVKLFTRIKNITRMFAPLILSSLDKVDVVSNAMALRGFARTKHRTWYVTKKLGFKDYLVLIILVSLIILSFYMRFFKGIKFVSLV